MITSIELDVNHINTVVFKVIHNIFPCNLSIKENSEIRPNIKLQFGNNSNFNNITISNFNLCSISTNNNNLQYKIDNVILIKYNNDQTVMFNEFIITHGLFILIKKPYSFVQFRLNSD